MARERTSGEPVNGITSICGTSSRSPQRAQTTDCYCKTKIGVRNQLGSPRLFDVQLWTWKTTQLFFEALNSRGDDEKDQNKLYLERMKNNVTLLIIETLGLSINSSGSIAEQLDDILQGAIELDKKFCQQGARWEWKYSYKSHHEGALVFDGDFMNLDRAERLSSDEKAQAQRLVRFVISPALIKRGGKDGMNDELETTVMKMVVSCKN
ncbi:uncharacterized protein FPRO_12096 [Fusarium proliferatum ET1]|uniref:Uncharacterized protein n=1 Tax=Fusarium proliferatum (strain ET1) TaxID=1227346 RepID=A0A1L7W2R8_FUSPR|nr:uncharacterized protein FPRO_12096 [Fusarium proliferatum ET1]CZR46646.1 uncharacterized protein FPRO_12096 [Fusarium proliferatum ET1]